MRGKAALLGDLLTVLLAPYDDLGAGLVGWPRSGLHQLDCGNSVRASGSAHPRRSSVRHITNPCRCHVRLGCALARPRRSGSVTAQTNGYRTPNIDRVANEGVAFTDYYGQQSCTAGRAAFITGQNPIRTGLTKVGMPGADVGLKAEDPTIAELLKPHGYVTGQFGKNHLGDKDEFLPTLHGFDEFFGNLYHLNAEEEPESPDYPKNPAFKKRFGPRGVLHAWADGKGGQKIEDTGPLTKKRMETIDDEVTGHALRFIEEAHKADKPFFVWYNTTAMHFRTHVADKHKGKSGQGDYNDVMVAHDENIGTMLNKLDELGIAEDTIVMYSTDNGVHYNSWPDAGITPFRSEKNTNWEGGWRVPAFVRWPGNIKAGSVLNGIVSHQDWLATFLAAAGEPDIKEKLLKGHTIGNKTYKVHIDGFNMLPCVVAGLKLRKFSSCWRHEHERGATLMHVTRPTMRHTG